MTFFLVRNISLCIPSVFNHSSGTIILEASSETTVLYYSCTTAELSSAFFLILVSYVLIVAITDLQATVGENFGSSS